MENRYKFIRYFSYVLEIVVFFAVQQTPGLIPLVYGSKPLLLIPMLVSIAIFEDEITGMWFGVFIGLLMDFGLSSVLGFNCILMATFGYFVGLLSVNFIKVNLFTSTICMMIVSVITYLLQFVFFYMLFMYGNNYYILLKHYLPRCVYTIAVSPIFYFFNKAISIQIRPREDQ